jgi:hypothetical protein
LYCLTLNSGIVPPHPLLRLVSIYLAGGVMVASAVLFLAANLLSARRDNKRAGGS